MLQILIFSQLVTHSATHTCHTGQAPISHAIMRVNSPHTDSLSLSGQYSVDYMRHSTLVFNRLWLWFCPTVAKRECSEHVEDNEAQLWCSRAEACCLRFGFRCFQLRMGWSGRSLTVSQGAAQRIATHQSRNIPGTRAREGAEPRLTGCWGSVWTSWGPDSRQTPDRAPTVNTREKSQCFSQARNKPLERRQSILFFLTGSALRRDYLTEPNQLGKEYYPTRAPSSDPVPPKRRENLKSTCGVHSPEAQDHSTLRPQSNSLHISPSRLYRPVYTDPLSSHHIWLSGKKHDIWAVQEPQQTLEPDSDTVKVLVTQSC